MRKLINWIFDHGVGWAYAFLVTCSLALASIVLVLAILLAKLMDKIR